MSWRVAKSLMDLRGEIDARWPKRDRATDGSIGNPAHAKVKSDHNPNSAGVVRALDIDSDGIPAGWLANHVRKRGEAGDKRLTPGGYVIFNHRIASDVGGWAWRAYTGSNPHTSHLHVSCTTSASGYDDGGSWGVSKADVPPSAPATPSGLPRFRRGSRVLLLTKPFMSGTDVRYLQRRLSLKPDGDFGPDTEAAVKGWQTAKGIEADGEVGPETWASLRVTT